LDARTPYPLGPAVQGEVPEVLRYCRYQGYENSSLKVGDKLITLPTFLATADESFFEMFTFPFVEGDPDTALVDRRSIVLTESMARTLFDEESPIGQAVHYVGWADFTVTGVIRDIPENSHIRFDVLVPIKEIAPGKEIGEDDWGPLFFYSYVQIAPKGSSEAAASKIASVLNENIPGLEAEIFLQPMKDVHLRSNFQWDLDNYGQGNQSILVLFSLAAAAILLLAIINFMNLSTARSSNRAKEVGMRKVSGAKRSEILAQFLGESVVHAGFGLLLALIMVQIALPFFNSLAGKRIVFADIMTPHILLFLLCLTLLTGFLAGAYPAIFLSSFHPAKVLKGAGMTGGRSQATLRKSLVVLQFALTFFLVIGTAVVDRQLAFVQDKDLGIDTQNVVTFFGDFRNVRSAKSAFLANPNVLSFTQSDSPQREQRGITDVFWEGKNPEDRRSFFPVSTDPDFLETFCIGLAEGRFFSYEFPSDAREAIVLNETAVRTMGFLSATDKRVTIGEKPYTVIGVVKDFHQSSLHRPIEPMILRWPEEIYQNCVRINPVNVEETLAFLEQTRKTFMPWLPDGPFLYEFLDERISGFYSPERKVESILRLFTAIALFTACLGLFGLASYLAEKRTKEIGIRKVLGAPIGSLIFLQTREFTKWILVSGLIAGPAAYYASHRWLLGFAYHINPGIGLGVFCVLATLIVAFLTVGFQSLRASLANPVDSLRHE
jgi:putative ABC transport system permease protein